MGDVAVNWWSEYQRWRPSFIEVMDLRYYRPEWLDGLLWSGRARFWGNERAAIVAELRQYPTGAIDVHGLVAAGDVNEIKDILIPEAEAWGRECGCIGAVIESRPAWSRVLKSAGYEPHQLSIRKELR